MNFKTYPRGYRQIEVMDFVHNRRQLLTVNLTGLAVMALMLIFGLIVHPFGPTWALLKSGVLPWLALAGMYFAYILLHELTHGILMHLLSGVRPKYGFQLCYAYAGSRVFFDRRSHNIIALAPLTVWGIALFLAQRAVPQEWFWIFYLIQISNVSGSMGDVYCVLHLWRKPKNIVIQDTGTRMRVFSPPVSSEESK